MYASFHGHTTVVETLLQHGTGVDKQEEVSSDDTISWAGWCVSTLNVQIQQCMRSISYIDFTIYASIPVVVDVVL